MNITFIYYGRYQVREAIELEYLSAIARQAGHRVSLAYDPGVFGITDNVLYAPFLARIVSGTSAVIKKAVSSKPDIIICSVSLNSYQWICDVLRDVKKRISVPVACVGPHATMVPEVLIKNPAVDFVVQGEPEGVLARLLDVVSGKVLPDTISSLWYKKEGTIHSNKIAPMVDVNALPLPDKNLFSRYVHHADSYMTMASRGCPYTCSYCEETAYRNIYHKNIYRKRSVQSVLHELTVMKKDYGFKEIIFKDPFFTADIDWLRAFMKAYTTAIGIPFKCFGKVSYFTEEIAQLLKDGGCYCVEFGIQTWNEDIRKKILARSETNEEALRVFHLCDQYSLRYDIDHMFGIPGETVSDHINAAKIYMGFAYLNRIKCHNLMYYPNMEIISHGINCSNIDDIYAAGLVDGMTADFFHTRRDAAPMKKINMSFRKLFKIMPCIPRGFVRYMLDRKRYMVFRFIPGMLIMAIQMLRALRSKDLRFLVYLKQYPFKILMGIKGRI